MSLPKEPAELEARLLHAIEALRLIENSLTAVVDRIASVDELIDLAEIGKTIRGLIAVNRLAARLAGEVSAEVSS